MGRTRWLDPHGLAYPVHQRFLYSPFLFFDGNSGVFPAALEICFLGVVSHTFLKERFKSKNYRMVNLILGPRAPRRMAVEKKNHSAAFGVCNIRGICGSYIFACPRIMFAQY
jgi:hypothetical protein